MERMEWINSMYEKYLNDSDMATDILNRKTSLAIAYANLTGEYIPDYVLKGITIVKDVKIGEMFVLKSTHKTYVKINENSRYSNACECTSIENGKEVSILEESEVEKIY